MPDLNVGIAVDGDIQCAGTVAKAIVLTKSANVIINIGQGHPRCAVPAEVQVTGFGIFSAEFLKYGAVDQAAAHATNTKLIKATFEVG